ncbi:MAG: hypothetical protein LBQ96_02535 [Fusobacteriaceae bacterium]|jgi:REP element-mobilizing transposase RayT|nr:hypothetical protein [Fusobacteriaceae bacterium]
MKRIDRYSKIENKYRHTTRLRGYDYSHRGLYMITIVTANRDCLLGDISYGRMELSDYGRIVQKCLLEIPEHFPKCYVHEYVIMPNHLHVLLELIWDYTEADGKVVQKDPNVGNFLIGPSKTIGSIVRGLKVGVTKEIGYSIFQKNYYDNIIPSRERCQIVRNYIAHNVEEWIKDRFYSEESRKRSGE